MIKSVINKIINSINFSKYKISSGNNCVYYGKIFFKTKKYKIKLGNNCIIRSGIETNPLGGMNECRFVTYDNGEIIIGNNVGISNSCLNAHVLIKIEDNVNIGGDCKIYDSNFHSIEYKNRISIPDNNIISKPVIIKNGAWIGAHSIILKGVTIGERSIVGAGSVVTKNIPNDEIWCGNPAKFVKKINQ